MATQTPNFKFDLRESADIFNPLSTNANFESLDTILKNLQETGGITTYTTTAAANLLKLSGTPKVNDTVFKFVAAGDANTWTGATGGVVNNIVALDGKQVTIKGGDMYVAWVNSANAMVVVAWPAVVDAQTFDGKGPTEWASKAQLDAVNQTAANATQTAQAAQTVANNALQVAQKAASISVVDLWVNPSPNSAISTQSITMNEIPENAKILFVTYKEISGSNTYTNVMCYVGDSIIKFIVCSTVLGDGVYSRPVRIESKTTATILGCSRGSVSNPTGLIPTKISAICW